MPLHNRSQFVFKSDFNRATCVTIFLIVIYLLCFQISIPFLNTDALREYYRLIDLQDSGDAVAYRFSIFSLGIIPYVSAYVLVELFSLFLAPLKKLRTGDFDGRKKLKQIALFLTLLLGTFHGASVISALNGMESPTENVF